MPPITRVEKVSCCGKRFDMEVEHYFSGEGGQFDYDSKRKKFGNVIVKLPAGTKLSAEDLTVDMYTMPEGERTQNQRGVKAKAQPDGSIEFTSEKLYFYHPDARPSAWDIQLFVELRRKGALVHTIKMAKIHVSRDKSKHRAKKSRRDETGALAKKPRLQAGALAKEEPEDEEEPEEDEDGEVEEDEEGWTTGVKRPVKPERSPGPRVKGEHPPLSSVPYDPPQLPWGSHGELPCDSEGLPLYASDACEKERMERIMKDSLMDMQRRLEGVIANLARADPATIFPDLVPLENHVQQLEWITMGSPTGGILDEMVCGMSADEARSALGRAAPGRPRDDDESSMRSGHSEGQRSTSAPSEGQRSEGARSEGSMLSVTGVMNLYEPSDEPIQPPPAEAAPPAEVARLVASLRRVAARTVGEEEDVGSRLREALPRTLAQGCELSDKPSFTATRAAGWRRYAIGLLLDALRADGPSAAPRWLDAHAPPDAPVFAALDGVLRRKRIPCDQKRAQIEAMQAALAGRLPLSGEPLAEIDVDAIFKIEKRDKSYLPADREWFRVRQWS